MNRASLKKSWHKLPSWVRGGITGAVLFLIIWNALFLLAYIFVIDSLWNVLFIACYPVLHPIIPTLDLLLGTCYTATLCFYRVPFIFVSMTLIEGFILGAIIQQLKFYFEKR